MTTQNGALAPDTSFSAALRAGTRQAHVEAEHRTFAGELVEGRVDRAGYAAMLGQLHFVYSSLEDGAAAMVDDPQAGPFVHPELHRREPLGADLQFLLGDGWRDQLQPLPATVAYCARLDEVGSSWPGGFVAHHYTRYLGDLSGGQVIRTMAEQTYGLDGLDGVRFYVFDQIDNPTAFKGRYRATLDAAAWDDDERQRIIDEATRAFELNSALFDDLGRHCAVPS